MAEKHFFASLTRISDLDSSPFETRRLPRSAWADGDYVVTEVISPPGQLVRAEPDHQLGRHPEG